MTMAFKGLRFAGLEWKNITASKVMWVVIAAIGIMPLLYGALYLAAFQDPYERLNTVPVAVVNEDEGAVISSESRSLGNDVVDELKSTDDGLEWHFVSAEEAQKGIGDGTYYMTCTIPSDFSASVASADSDSPNKAQLKIEYNQSENMLASQIGESVWKEVRTRVSDTIAIEYWETVLNRVADSGEDIQTAADGAGQLRDALGTAQDGSQIITTNLGELADGATTLDDGLVSLENGAFTLEGGASSLVSGMSQLKSGTGQLAQATASLPDDQEVEQAKAASQQISDGIGALQGAAGELAGGADQVKAGLGSPGDTEATTVYGGLNALSEGASALGSGAVSVQQGIGSSADSTADATLYGLLNDASKALEAGDTTQAQQLITAAQGATDQLSSGVGSLQGGVTQLGAGIDQVKAGVGTPADDPAAQKTVYAGLNALSSGIGASSDSSATTMYGGLNSLAAGYENLSSSLLTLVEQTPPLRSAIVALDEGTASAAMGASQLDTGASQLAAGSQSARGGADQIASGAAQLEEGSSTLGAGLGDAVEGADELATKLDEGADTAAEQTSNIDGKAEVMSDPVELVNEYYTTVKNYGTGFAPYFMALGLWVGSLVAGFVFKPLNNRLIMSGGNPVMVAFANYLPMAFFSLIQATLLMVVLQFGLQLQIDNVPAFYGMGYLIALVFAAIMQMLMAAFGFPGKFVAIILLMLQLTACAGTFPIQTTPEFFQVVSPYMPMTYVVSGMRQIMTGLDYGVVGFDCLVLLGLGAICFALTCLVAYRRRTVRMDDLHPVLQLG